MALIGAVATFRVVNIYQKKLVTALNGGLVSVKREVELALDPPRSFQVLSYFGYLTGIIGTGMLAIPVLAGSAAYAVAETFRWRRGLDRKPREARGFYAIVALATLGGTALTFSPIDPIRALFWSAVINGVISVPVLIVIMLLAGNAKVMGKFVSSARLKFVGLLATAVMAAAVCAMFFATD